MEVFIDVMIHEDFQRVGFLGFVFSPIGHEGLGIFYAPAKWGLRYTQRQLEIMSLKD